MSPETVCRAYGANADQTSKSKSLCLHTPPVNRMRVTAGFGSSLKVARWRSWSNTSCPLMSSFGSVMPFIDCRVMSTMHTLAATGMRLDMVAATSRKEILLGLAPARYCWSTQNCCGKSSAWVSSPFNLVDKTVDASCVPAIDSCPRASRCRRNVRGGGVIILRHACCACCINFNVVVPGREMLPIARSRMPTKLRLLVSETSEGYMHHFCPASDGKPVYFLPMKTLVRP